MSPDLSMTPSEMASALEARAPYYSDWAKDIRELNGTSVDADHADKTAALLRAAAQKLRQMDAENARLRKPDFYWDPDDPETPRDHAFEYMDDYRPGEVREWMTGNQTGYVYAVMLEAEEDADSDDEWTFEASDKAAVHNALAEELARRAARRARTET